MKALRLLFLVLLTAGFALQADAKGKDKEKEPEVITIYAFGVSHDLADSTVYVTSIAPINGATMLPHGILQNIQYYGEQMKKYVEKTYNLQHQTVAFYYARDRKKAEKRLARVQAKMKKHTMKNLEFKPISYEDFRFKVPVLVDSTGEY